MYVTLRASEFEHYIVIRATDVRLGDHSTLQQMADIDNTQFDQSDLNSVKRNKDRASYDKQQIKAIFKEARICHVAFIHDGLPQCIPMIGAIEETAEGDLFVYFHGACLTVRSQLNGFIN